MALNPIGPRLRNISNGLAKIQISIPAGEEIVVSDEVAAQIAHQGAPLRDESVPVPGPKVTEPLEATKPDRPAKKAPAKKAARPAED